MDARAGAEAEEVGAMALTGVGVGRGAGRGAGQGLARGHKV